MTVRISVTLEITPKRSFATAADWPGWSRSGKSSDAALAALIEYADRYASLVVRAGESILTEDLEFAVDDTGDGNATTEFGAPARITDLDRRAVTADEGTRLARLVGAAWVFLDETAATAPESLRKGPRGGGRDTSMILDHVAGAEQAYAREIGIRRPPSDGANSADGSATLALREAILRVLRQPSDGLPIAGRRWTPRYAAHRIAWHVLDHAWEIEDRSVPEPDQPDA